MKKKKLKKKIKKLEHRVNYICKKLSSTIDSLNLSESHVMQCKEAITRLENQPNQPTEDIQRQINELKTKISCHDNRLSVLDARSRVDYTMYSTKEEKEKTCDTCKWKPLLEQDGQDIPCMGCTDDDKKMWKSKES